MIFRNIGRGLGGIRKIVGRTLRMESKRRTCIFRKNLYGGAIWTVTALEQPRFIVGTNAGNLMLRKNVHGEKVVSICVLVDDTKIENLRFPSGANAYFRAWEAERLFSGTVQALLPNWPFDLLITRQ